MATSSSASLLGDPAAIAANRVGQLTPWQRQRLRPPSLVGSLMALAFSLAVLAVGAFFFLLYPLSSLLRDDPDITALFSFASGELIVLVMFLGIFGFFALLVSGGLIIPTTRRLRLKLRLRRDLAEGYIAQEDGQVTFLRKSGYVARGSGGSLLNLDGGKAVALPPGDYHFYYLPRTRRILSAEAQTYFGQGGQQLSLLAALALAHGFGLDELDTNRQGWLSGHQRFTTISGILYYPMIIGTLVVLLIVATIEPLKINPWLVALVACALALLIFPYRTMRDLREGRVALLDGNIQRKEDSDSDGDSTYYYVLDTQKFRVSWDAYEALIPGVTYRLYYLPRCKKIVSIEPLP